MPGTTVKNLDELHGLIQITATDLHGEAGGLRSRADILDNRAQVLTECTTDLALLGVNDRRFQRMTAAAEVAEQLAKEVRIMAASTGEAASAWDAAEKEVKALIDSSR
jgi:hypothetical protein